MARSSLYASCNILIIENKLTMPNTHGEEIGPIVEGYSNQANAYSSSGGQGGGYGVLSMYTIHRRRAHTASVTATCSDAPIIWFAHPAYVSRSRTPTWNADSRTPNPHAYADSSCTPAWDVGSKTTNSHGYVGDGSKTPA
ncbi:hypothetical protein BC936DRAFT_144688 [Jimgerdemannia flammicorona]|uniref:Uncharacterized protein n=1 Tax=Jimgerdemannia flammicorona TaxID=994334 RepID=A0A433DBY2_9FUNG|nr:hypothetical protein BC936DRAFT_144688 [Jimgerdemannia flammicorona]